MSENDKEYRDGVLLNDKAPEFRRDCRRAVQERLDRMTSVHSIPDETGGINRTDQPMWRSKR